MVVVEVTLALVLLGVVAFLVYREWYHSAHMEKLEYRYFTERQMLLDRVMARNFVEYKQGEVAAQMTQAQVQQPGVADADDFDWSKLGE